MIADFTGVILTFWPIVKIIPKFPLPLVPDGTCKL